MIIKGMIYHDIDKCHLAGIKKRYPFGVNKIVFSGTAVKIETDRRRHFRLAKPDQITQTPVLFALVKVKYIISQNLQFFSQLLRKIPQCFDSLCKQYDFLYH